MDRLGLLFTWLTLGLVGLQILFLLAGDKYTRRPWPILGLLLLTLVLVGLYSTKDMLYFFLFWSAGTWLTFLLSNNPRKAFGYLWISLLGEFAMLSAVGYTYALTGSTAFSALAKAGPIAIVLFCLPFVIKTGVIPFNFWVGDLYTGSDKRFVLFLSAIISKLGVFGVLRTVSELSSLPNLAVWQNLFIYLAGITAIWATFKAVGSEDAIEALSFSSLSQVSFIFASVLLWSAVSVSGAVLHYLNHMLIKLGMFSVVIYIWRKIGSTEYTAMGDFVRKMPISFLFFLMLGISLAGVPPMGGFNSKWLMYEAFISKGRLLPVLLFFVAGVGSFLYVYRLLHSIFLGRKKASISLVKEMNPLQIIPLVVSGVVSFLIGAYVKPFMELINGGLTGIFDPVSVTKTGIGIVNLSLVLEVFGLLLGAVVILFWILLPRHRYAPDTEGYTAAAYLPEQIRLWDYSYNFYAPVNRLGKGFVQFFSLGWLGDFWREYIAGLGLLLRGLYNGRLATYGAYIMLTLGGLIVALSLLISKGS